MKLVMAGLLLLLMVLPAQARHKGHHGHRHHAHRVNHAGGGQIVPNPAGCPRVAFCGCGVARFVFGQVDGAMRPLWLAAEWLRFKRAAPAAGMVAVRKDRHHVIAIKEVRGKGRVLAYDPNSGGHKTRVHEVSLARYTVVDPRRRI